MSRIPFKYWHFYDYPRNMRLVFEGRHFYLHSPFLEDEDEFATYYQVFELVGFATEEELKQKLYGRFYPSADMLRYIGQITIAALDIFKERRTDIAAEPFRTFLAQHGYRFPTSDAQEG